MRYGAKVLLEGSCFDDSLAYALHYAPSEGREFISPYDGLDVITGQATVAWEVLEEMKDEPPVIGRSIVANGREQAVAVRIQDEPGQLGYILDFLRRKRATVLDLRRSWKSRSLISGMADIEILIETEDEHHGQEVLQELAKEARAHNFELLLEAKEPEVRS